MVVHAARRRLHDPNSGGDSGFAVLDFSLFSTFRDNVSRGSFSQIGGVLTRDWVYGDATKLVTFLQNHDVGPDNDFRFRFSGDRGWPPPPTTCCGRSAASPASTRAKRSSSRRGRRRTSSADDTLDMTGRAYYGDT